MKSKKQAIRLKQQRKQMITRLALGGVVVLVLGLIAFTIVNRPVEVNNQAIPVMPDTSHVAERTDPGPYNSDPPTSGRHYAETYKAGFYAEDALEVRQPFPEGHLVHNLEHGYVIFWYNCKLLSAEECSDLKAQIQQVMDKERNNKLIAFPRDTLEVPVVMTTWGQMLKLETFDSKIALAFIQRFRNKAPEPNAP